MNNIDLMNLWIESSNYIYERRKEKYMGAYL